MTRAALVGNQQRMQSPAEESRCSRPSMLNSTSTETKGQAKGILKLDPLIFSFADGLRRAVLPDWHLGESALWNQCHVEERHGP
jgi:hypothetical protein